MLLLAVGYVAWHGQQKAVYAATAGDEDSGGGGDDDDDDKPKGDDDDDDTKDKDQPPVTSGGLFTLKTYPVNAILRPLTMTKDIAQVQVGVGTDVSNKGAFKSAGVNVDAVYGYTDNFMLLGGIDSAYNFNAFQVYGGFEGSLAYDLIDFRLAGRIGRFAGVDPVMGTSAAGPIKVAADIGFPFRYQAKPEIAIVALQTLMSIDFNGDDGNKATPDLNPSVGIATNPIPQLSLVVFAQLHVVDFDFTNNLSVPATAHIQFSPNQKLDIGAEFTLQNIKADDPFAARFLSLFVAARMGK